jgi:hypothetical protein
MQTISIPAVRTSHRLVAMLAGLLLAALIAAGALQLASGGTTSRPSTVSRVQSTHATFDNCMPRRPC